MTKKRKIYEKLKNNPKKVRFEEFCKAADFLVFDLEVERVAMEFTLREDIKEILSFQNVKGKAKPYRVRHVKRD